MDPIQARGSVTVSVIPSEDSHSSEYIAPCDARREFICGFSGSAGCAVITHEKAALATDGRYFNQATKQLDDNWTLLKQGLQDVPTWQEWSASEAAGGKIVGVDPTLLTSTTAGKLSQNIKNKGGSDMVAVTENLVDIVWGESRPSRPNEPVKLLPQKYAGKDTRAKLHDLRKEMKRKQLGCFVVSMLDEVAWLFNLRGNDIPFNPVFFSYAIITADEATLYVDSAKLDEDAHRYLAESSVTVKPYDSLFEDANALRKTLPAKDANNSTDSNKTVTAKKFGMSTKGSWALKLALGGDEAVEEIRSPVGDAKAIKNETELEGMRQCHIRDGAALTAYFAWLEDQLINKKVQLDEVEAADKLEELRSKQKDFVGLSFPTISSTGPNAAVIHYSPERGNCSTIDPNAVYLCDSGAQYLDGTTDTTRTFHFGTPTEKEKQTYTLVLKGNIALDMAIFPKGVTGYALDGLARQFLWKEGLDYRHGTGHGVGSYLNVHEGPIGIGTRKQYSEVYMAAGNVTSIEPGYYEDGLFGIRIENVAIVKEVKTPFQFGDRPYLGFEHVTMTPYCRNLLDVNLLTTEEKQWLNDHHAEIFEKTKDFFKDDDLTMAWLKRETAPL
ncbi:putative Xaa-Pro aminopeptidase P [Cytospora mali]|uniref:Probable Xaa-Pro aminopeptidase P n=1 Tax=Cytospora mali TaxID=578113 RepID=A0A194V605_CYTMA|nr:putative Xaa-Pro aminopeptidase P [Valsa mali var. pyri (nom. inval.)]